MAWFRRNKTRNAPATSTPVPPPRRPWLDHGLSGGERVDCSRCGRGLTVVLQSSSEVMLTHDGVLDGMALICTECGRFCCEACALLHSPHLAKCPHCVQPAVPPMT